jgi:hypothetical protein
MKATKEGKAEANFVVEIKRCAAEMQEGRRLVEEGGAMSGSCVGSCWS